MSGNVISRGFNFSHGYCLVVPGGGVSFSAVLSGWCWLIAVTVRALTWVTSLRGWDIWVDRQQTAWLINRDTVKCLAACSTTTTTMPASLWCFAQLAGQATCSSICLLHAPKPTDARRCWFCYGREDHVSPIFIFLSTHFSGVCQPTVSKLLMRYYWQQKRCCADFLVVLLKINEGQKQICMERDAEPNLQLFRTRLQTKCAVVPQYKGLRTSLFTRQLVETVSSKENSK